jgi:hypothetical protein
MEEYINNIYCYDKRARTPGYALIFSMLPPLAASLYFLPYGAVNIIISLPLILSILAGILIVRAHSNTICLLRNGFICRKRGGASITVTYSDVIYARHRQFPFRALAVKTPKGKIYICSNIIGYQKLYKELAKFIPSLRQICRESIKLNYAPLLTFVPALMIALMLLSLTGYMISETILAGFSLFSTIFGGGLSLFIIVFLIVSALKHNYAILLDAGSITEVSVLKDISHDVNDINRILFGQMKLKSYSRYRAALMVNYIEFEFTDGTIVCIDDRYIAYPIEYIAQYAEEKYKIDPEFRMIPSR